MGMVLYQSYRLLRTELRFCSRTAEEIVAREKIEKSKNHLRLMALQKLHLAKKWNALQLPLKTGPFFVLEERRCEIKEGVDWTNHSEDEDYALMALACKAQTQTQRHILKVLRKLKHSLLLINKDNFETQKEKDELKAKVEKWHNLSKNLGKLLNSQMSAYDKFMLGYGDHRYNGILSYENEVLQSVFKSKESDFENQPMHDRFAEGMHDVPPPMTGNYMPSGPDVEVDDSKFTYGPKQTQPNESETQSSEIDTCEPNISTEPFELVSEPVINESNVKSQPKVWSDAPIIEEYESDSEDECVVI
ncbi:hypothetical protein Tco_0574465, partial [Tanacetum coccineum]